MLFDRTHRQNTAVVFFQIFFNLHPVHVGNPHGHFLVFACLFDDPTVMSGRRTNCKRFDGGAERIFLTQPWADLAKFPRASSHSTPSQAMLAAKRPSYEK